MNTQDALETLSAICVAAQRIVATAYQNPEQKQYSVISYDDARALREALEKAGMLNRHIIPRKVPAILVDQGPSNQHSYPAGIKYYGAMRFVTCFDRYENAQWGWEAEYGRGCRYGFPTRESAIEDAVRVAQHLTDLLALKGLTP
jgi:hypothetical protein